MSGPLKHRSNLALFIARLIIMTSVHQQFNLGATVEHQASTFPRSWSHGASWQPLARNDFLQSDFYGESLQGSFVRKVLEDLTPHQPFGYQTSFSVELRDHNGKKSESILEAKASAAIADASAFIFIDAILTLLARGIRTPTNVWRT